ncbi:hypothetical protein Back2_00550 [Nocardioides baekrokdamisoli]|uniref:Uncharacterized protein n=1 Tax=Nocardioides baekrokdamisoli TaxID=1804624 RepID=A0A3G9IWY4_9ACTN|nr:hypothetical protein [Nocardioides baekrokdamisoli]BBH15768.1 hypothetical protein Back2_00550 [Nocardioides baekrokdamisoli]
MTNQEITNVSTSECPGWCNAHAPGLDSKEPYLHIRSWPSGVVVSEYWEQCELDRWAMTERGIQIEGLHRDRGPLDRSRAADVSHDLLEAIELLDSIGGFYALGDAG